MSINRTPGKVSAKRGAAGDMLSTNNLSDVTTPATALSNIGGVGAATTHTFTNKTFDANGTGNSLSNVDVADLANGTDGELITWGATSAPAVVAVGTVGQVLTSGGVGVAPTMQDASGGAWDFLSTATASNAASLDITSADGLDSATYKAYRIYVEYLYGNTTGQVLYMRVSDDNGSTFFTGAGYVYAVFGGDADAVAINYGSNGGGDHLTLSQAISGASAVNGQAVEGWIDIPIVVAATSGTAKIQWRLSYQENTSNDHEYYDGFGTDYSTKDAGGTDAYRFIMDSGNITGKIHIWGLKAS